MSITTIGQEHFDQKNTLFKYSKDYYLISTLAISTGNISRSLAVLSGSEENSALSGAIAQLSTVQEKIEQIHFEQATADFYYLSELIKDYIGLVGAVKDVFQVQ